MTTNRHEFRSVAGLEAVRADGDGSPIKRLRITFARFDEWTHIRSWEGEFLERITRGAFLDTFAERGPEGSGMIRCLFQHGRDPSIGSKILGRPTSLREGEVGPVGEVELLTNRDGSVVDYAADIAAGVDAGGYGASYRFGVRGGVDGEVWNKRPAPSEHNPRGLPERTLTRLNVSEFGPVTFPADEGTNEAGLVAARSLDQYFADNPDDLPAVLAAGALRTGNEVGGVDNGARAAALRARGAGRRARIRQLRG